MYYLIPEEVISRTQIYVTNFPMIYFFYSWSIINCCDAEAWAPLINNFLGDQRVYAWCNVLKKSYKQIIVYMHQKTVEIVLIV